MTLSHIRLFFIKYPDWRTRGQDNRNIIKKTFVVDAYLRIVESLRDGLGDIKNPAPVAADYEDETLGCLQQ
jgi:hypothetical protein